MVQETKFYMFSEAHGLYLLQEWDNTVLVVNGREVTVREMEVGHWYVFRVAAVDARGSAGFVESPVPFRLQTEPMAPSPPYNLTAIESTVCFFFFCFFFFCFCFFLFPTLTGVHLFTPFPSVYCLGTSYIAYSNKSLDPFSFIFWIFFFFR